MKPIDCLLVDNHSPDRKWERHISIDGKTAVCGALSDSWETEPVTLFYMNRQNGHMCQACMSKFYER